MTLVKNKNVSQQTSFTDNVACCFANNHSYIEKDHYKWCKDNNVGEYLNYRAPIYKPGRAILGKNVQEIINVANFHKCVLDKFPKFVGSYISTDKNTEIIDYV